MHRHGRQSGISAARKLIRALVYTTALTCAAALTTGCNSSDGDAGIPTAPTPPSNPTPPTPPPGGTTAPQLTGITADPGGVGIQHATMFNFGLTGEMGASSTITWTSDGNGVNGAGPTTSHIFTQPGTFTVKAEARNSAGTSAVTKPIEIKGLVGVWEGVVTDHVQPPGRPTPIRSFELRIDSVLTRVHTQIVGQWVDNAGCRQGILVGAVNAPRTVDISIEQLPCNDRDFTLSGTVDPTGNVIEGRCPNGGPNCAFRMTRR